ncbi:hypothetical protein B0A52_05638 [Exophiala mesophila]|nr:hypothetical protein B0A52_05638 [Exophiala mesophila]
MVLSIEGSNQPVPGVFGFPGTDELLDHCAYVESERADLAQTNTLEMPGSLSDGTQSSVLDQQTGQDLVDAALNIPENVFAFYDEINLALPQVDICGSQLCEPDQTLEHLNGDLNVVLNVLGDEESVQLPSQEGLTTAVPASPPISLASTEAAAIGTPLPTIMSEMGRPVHDPGLEMFRGAENGSLSGNLAKEIDELIALGLRNVDNLTWFSRNRVSSNDVLLSFKPSTLLHRDAVSETISALADDGDQIVRMEIQQFYQAFSQRQVRESSSWDDIDFIVVPVHEGNRCFLVSADVKNRLIRIHDFKSHEEIVRLLTETDNQWPFEHKALQEVSDNDSGIVVLREVESLVEPGLSIRSDIEALRKRYLLCLLTKILPRDQHFLTPMDPQTSVMSQSFVNTQYPYSPDFQQYLASAIGCEAVLQDLSSMVTSFLEDPPNMRQELGSMVRMYDRGDANSFLATFQKDFSSLFVARRFHSLVATLQAEKKEQHRITDARRKVELRRKLRDGANLMSNSGIKSIATGKKGENAATVAYNRMIQECGPPSQSMREGSSGQLKADTKRRLKEIKYRGDILLRYDHATGPNHPLWTLFPMRAIQCPAAPEILIDPIMYRRLKEPDIKVLVDLFRLTKPKLWDYLPRFQCELIKLLSNDIAEVTVLQEMQQILSTSFEPSYQ